MKNTHAKVIEKNISDHFSELLTVKAQYDKDTAMLEKRLAASLNQMEKERLMWQVLEHQMKESFDDESVKLSAEKKRHRDLISDQLDKAHARETDIAKKIQDHSKEKYNLNEELVMKRRMLRQLKKRLKRVVKVSELRKENLRLSKVRWYDIPIDYFP